MQKAGKVCTFASDDFQLALRENALQLCIHGQLVPLCQDHDGPALRQPILRLHCHAMQQCLCVCYALERPGCACALCTKALTTYLAALSGCAAIPRGIPPCACAAMHRGMHVVLTAMH